MVNGTTVTEAAASNRSSWMIKHTFGMHSGVGFSLGTAIDTRISAATEVLNTAAAWYPAVNPDDGIHDGAWVAEATDLVDHRPGRTGSG